MVYKHGEYTLFKKDVVLRGGRNQTIYFFAKGKPKSGTACEKPKDKVVGVNGRTGLPYLRKA